MRAGESAEPNGATLMIRVSGTRMNQACSSRTTISAPWKVTPCTAQATFRPAARCRGTRTASMLVLIVWGTCMAQPIPTDVPLHWVPFVHIPGVVDLSAARRDGSLTVTAGGLLFLLPTGTLLPFARGPGGYATDPGAEAYLALARQRRVPGARCAFRRDDVYALEVAAPGVVVIDSSGQV